MICQKLITVESYDDPDSIRMLQRLYQNEDFKDLKIFHCFIGRANSGDEIFQILSAAITEYKPEVALIHTGEAFSRLYKIFFEALQLLTSDFPDVKLGVQDRHNQRKSLLKLMSNDEFILRLEEKIFRTRR